VQRAKPATGNEALKTMILDALDAAGGDRWLQKQAKENPTAFMALVGKVLPLTLAADADKPLFPDKIQISFVGAKNGKPA
jgi:hypothetical protein